MSKRGKRKAIKSSASQSKVRRGPSETVVRERAEKRPLITRIEWVVGALALVFTISLAIYLNNKDAKTRRVPKPAASRPSTSPVKPLTPELDDEPVFETALSDFEYEQIGDEIVITKYNGSAERVVIPYGVTRIGAEAFDFSGDDFFVVVPVGKTLEEVTTAHLREVVFPPTLKSIESYAFCGSYNLKEVDLPDGLESIGENAFWNCSIEEVYLPDSVSEVAPNAFGDSKNGLTKYVVSEDNERFKSIDGVLFSKDMTTLYSCPRTYGKYRVPEGVKHIAPSAFAYSSTEKIELPEGLESIGERAFRDCILKEVTLPASLSEIGDQAFGGYPRTFVKGDIVVSEENEYFTAVDGVLFSRDMTTLVCDCRPLRKGYCVPYGVKRIRPYAFACKFLNSIDLPSGLESIGYGAFFNCQRLKKPTIPKTVAEPLEYFWHDGIKLWTRGM